MASDLPNSKYALERDENGRRRFRGASSVKEYDFLGKLGEGTFGEVSKARSKKTGAVVALKKIIMHNEKDGFPITALREIKLLKILDHINILKLEEMAVEHAKGEAKKKSSMYMVTPYMDHDLSGLLENPDVHFSIPQIKCYMLQLLEGVRYLHESKILHRDMKAANLLINNKGILQIADFGLARPYEGEPPRAGQGGGEATREYTALVVTRWYRPPELLLQLREYTTAIDMWGVGCVFAEMFKGKPILAGKTDLDQAHLIFDLVGSPTEENMPGWSKLPGCEGVKQFEPKKGNLATEFRDQGPLTISLLTELLKLDWRKRINAIDALKHPYFQSQPYPAKPGELPRFEDSHELDRRIARGQKQALPPAPKGGSVGMGEWKGQGPPGGRVPNPMDFNRGPPPRLPPNKQYTNGHGPPRRGPVPYDVPPPPPPPPPPGNTTSQRILGPQEDIHQRPNWHREPYPAPQPPAVGLPPKPPPVSYQPPHHSRDRDQRPLYHSRDRDLNRDRDRNAPPPPRRIPDPPQSGVGAGKVDTYIPSYSNAPIERDRERERPPYRSRDDAYPPRRPERERGDEGYDRPGMYDDRMYDERGGTGSVAGSGGGRRGRSRSPERDREWRRGGPGGPR